MEHKHMTVAFTILALVVVGMFVFAYLKKSEIAHGMGFFGEFPVDPVSGAERFGEGALLQRFGRVNKGRFDSIMEAANQQAGHPHLGDIYGEWSPENYLGLAEPSPNLVKPLYPKPNLTTVLEAPDPVGAWKNLYDSPMPSVEEMYKSALEKNAGLGFSKADLDALNASDFIKWP
jgi:hypothetical protein